MKRNISNSDTLLVFIFFALICFGWMNIFSATFNGNFNMSAFYGRQLMWIGISCISALFLNFLNSQFYRNITIPLYILTVVLVFLTAFIGKETNGAKSWLGIGSFGIQPAEFAKYATCLFLANYLSKPAHSLNIRKNIWISVLIILLPVFCILLQNDTGSAIPFVFLIFTLIREGLTLWVLGIGFILILLLILTLLIKQWIIFLCITLVFVFLFIRMRKHKKYFLGLFVAYAFSLIYVFSIHTVYDSVLKEYQKERIELVLGRTNDTQNIGYNVNQSKIAIGSGGLFGQGFMKGTQTTMNFVPEQSTDFIFCTVGEEWGFIGSALLILTYALLIFRIIKRSEEQRDSFIRIYGYNIACIFFSHLMINIGMTLGLLPVIGIPLPFISYGGSSLIAYTFMLFTFIAMDAKTSSWG